MATAYTADELLEGVRRTGSLPSASSTGTADADLLAHADGEMRDTLVPMMLGVREEMYERVFDTTTVADVAGYRINKRAALSRLNTVQWVGSSSVPYNLERLEPKRVAELGVVGSGQPVAYYLEGGRMVLTPTPSAGGTLRVRAFVRPSKLTLSTDTTNVLPITAVSVGASSTTLTTAAHGISVSGIRDVVASTPSFEHLAVDATATTVLSTTVTIPNTSFTTAPIVGDYLCVSDYSPYVQLPVELHPSLVQLTLGRTLRSLGKLSEAAAAMEEAQRLVLIGISALTPRVETADRKILGGPHWRNKGWGYLRGGP